MRKSFTGKYFNEADIITDESTLEEIKEIRIRKVDERTKQLIESGFTYNGNQFSMSDAAQKNWIALATLGLKGWVAYPYEISTKDENKVSLANSTELDAFLMAYATYQTDPSQPLGTGRVLKEQISSATTKAELDLIVDNR